MGTWLEREMRVRVAALWAARTASVPLDPHSSAWEARGPSSQRVAMLFLAYREQKDKTPGKRKLDMKNFLREEGTKTVTSPLTGEKVKLKTLTGPKYQEDPKSKDFLNKLFQEWRDKNKAKGDEAPEEAPTPKDKADTPKNTTPEGAPEAPAQDAEKPSQDAPAPPTQDEAPAAPSQDAPEVEQDVPEPDLSGEEPASPQPEPPQAMRGKFKSIVDALRGKDLTPEELKALDDFDDWLRDLVGLEERQRDKPKKEKQEQPEKRQVAPIPQFNPSQIPVAVTKAVKNKIQVSELPRFQTFALKLEKSEKESEAPKNAVKTKHQLEDEDDKALNRVKQTLDKRYRNETVKFNKAKRRFDKEKEKADKDIAEATKYHDTVRSELEAAGESKETFDSARKFVERTKKREDSAMAEWEKARDKAEAKGEEPPEKPEPVDAHVEWLKDHKAKWEAQPEDTRGEYKPPMVTREMFEKIQKAPTIPKTPEPLADPPQPPSIKELRQEIEDSDPDLAAKFENIPDDEFEVLVTPPPQKSVAELKAEFLDTLDDPDLKSRVMEMDPDEFEELLASLRSGQGGKGKKGSLTEWVLRVAYVRPDLREHLLWAVTSSVLGGR